MTKENDDRPELRSERMRQVMGNIPQILLVWGTVATVAAVAIAAVVYVFLFRGHINLLP
jgi:hypothetical protein